MNKTISAKLNIEVSKPPGRYWASFFVAMLIISVSNFGFAQSRTQKELLKASDQIFRLEVADQIDSLGLLLDNQLVVLNSAGVCQTKEQYISRLKSGNFKHDAISVEEVSALIAGNTGVVTGKGKFSVTVNGHTSDMHLGYLETFIRTNANAGWKLLALHASVIPNPVAK